MANRSIKTLVEVLKSSPRLNACKPKKWQELEEHVQYVYQELLRKEYNSTMVARDLQIRGRDGASYQIDVYYEFELAGIKHRVAIECKDSSRPLERHEVMAFKSILEDCIGITGVIVASNGFQSGAIKYANDNKITILSYDELPTISFLLGSRIENIAIPAKDAIGQPFWTIYDIDTAAPYGQYHDGEAYAFLFYTKMHAEQFRINRQLEPIWEVRGLGREQLRGYIFMVDSFAGKYLISRPSYANEVTKDSFIFDEVKRDDFITNFCEGLSLPEDPMVLPHLVKK